MQTNFPFIVFMLSPSFFWALAKTLFIWSRVHREEAAWGEGEREGPGSNSNRCLLPTKILNDYPFPFLLDPLQVTTQLVKRQPTDKSFTRHFKLLNSVKLFPTLSHPSIHCYFSHSLAHSSATALKNKRLIGTPNTHHAGVNRFFNLCIMLESSLIYSHSPPLALCTSQFSGWSIIHKGLFTQHSQVICRTVTYHVNATVHFKFILTAFKFRALVYSTLPLHMMEF